jgi:GMP synthase-like glutamine amidotransferase
MSLLLYIGFAQPDEWPHWAGTYARHAQRFEAARGGLPCLVIPFYHSNSDLIERLRPKAVVMSGFARSFEQYEPESFRGLLEWVDRTKLPLLNLCGSHQLMGYRFNGETENGDPLCDKPMRRLRPGEPVANPDYHPEHYMERGFYAVEIASEG